MPVNNDAREMPLISKENAEKYYDELLANYHYKTDYLYNKVPILKDHMENQILKEVTKIDEFKIHFPGEPMGQWQWLKNNMEDISNHKTSGYIPQDLVAGIEHLSKARNRAVHKQDMKPAGYLGHFCTVAETIEFFSKVPIPKDIEDILYLRNTKDHLNSECKRDEKNVPPIPKNKKSQPIVVSSCLIKGDSFEELEEDMNRCHRCNRCNPIKVLYNDCITSKVMFIAQAPGNYNDKTILVRGKAGTNFQNLLDHINWKRENIFITNAVLCYSSGKPNTTQIRECNPYLIWMIDLVNPEVVVTLGDVAFNAIHEIEDTNCDPDEAIHEEPREIDWNGRKLFPLELPGLKVTIPRPGEKVIVGSKEKQFINDFKKLADIVDPISGLKNR